MFYNRFCSGLNDRGILVPETELGNITFNPSKDAYSSIFQYDEIHYRHFLTYNSIAGITDVTTNKLVFDFDSQDNLELARKEALVVIERLQTAYSIPKEAVAIYFSGKKGFTLVIQIDKRLTPTQLKELCYNHIGKGLQTIDGTLYNASRILRIPWTKHQESGLYKIPLKYDTLFKTSINDIKLFAVDITNLPDIEVNYVAYLNETFIPSVKKQAVISSANSTKFLDFTIKPKFLSSCRFSLQNGRFHEGDRNSAFLCLASTYKNLGFDLEHTYRLLKGVAELQSKYTDIERYSDEELYNNIVAQVYSINWKGGQFSCRDKNSWLYEYCQSLGVHACQHSSEQLTVKSNDVFQMFYDYTQNYDKNILYTGIKELDDQVKLMCGTSNAIVGPPGAGKTSLLFQILNHTSKNNIPSIFFSYDMFHAPVYLRLLQRHTGKTQDEIYHIFKTDEKKSKELQAIITNEYRNVEFCFKSGQTPDEMVDTIRAVNEKLGTQRVKLVVVDYNELVSASTSDPTAASAEIAQKLRQIANEEEVCMLTLLQPSKMFTNPTEDIKSFTAAKGSSAIAQSLTLMLGISRPGYNVREPERDKFFTINCLKNRNGSLFSLDLKWNGLRGTVDSLSMDERIDLANIREQNKLDKLSNEKSKWG